MTIITPQSADAADAHRSLANDTEDSVGQLALRWRQAVSNFNAAPGTSETSRDSRFRVLLSEGDGGPSDRPPGANTPTPHPPPAYDPTVTNDPSFVPPPPNDPHNPTITCGRGAGHHDAVSALEAPLQAAALLSNNWNRWDLGSIDWAHPPATLPPEALNALSLVEGNPALLNAIKAGGDNGSVDGPITRDSLGKFVGNAAADLAQATKDFQAWQKANPNADATATELARSAALLEANATLLANAAGSSVSGLSGNVFNAADLAALASNNPGLSPELTGAAKLWSDPGMLRQIDQAGQSPLSNPDGLVNGANIGAWLTSNAPGGTDSVMDFFNLVASRDAVNNVDTSSLTADVFAHPENYSAAQKAAVLQELKDAQDRMTFDNQNQVTDIGTQQKDGINPNIFKTSADLQSKIDQLSADPDVQTYLSGASTGALQSLVNADPGMKAVFNDAMAKFESGQTLNDDLAAKDSSGKQVSPGEALHTYLAQAGFFQLAMGENGAPAADLDLTAIAKKSGSYDTLANYYTSEIVSGKRLQELLDGGDDPVNAAAQFSQEVEAFGNVIDPSVVAGNTTTLQNNFQDVLSEHTFENLTAAQLETALGDGHGNLDESKLDALIANAAASNPDLSGSVNNPASEAAQVVHIIKAVWDGVRSGERMVDVLKTAGKMSFNDNEWHTAYKVGAFHGATAILGGIYLGLSLGGHTPTDPGQITADVGAGINTFGVLTVGAGRGIRSIDSPAMQAAKESVTAAQNAKNDADKQVTDAQTALDDAQKSEDGARTDEQKAQTAYDKDEHDLDAARANFNPATDAALQADADRAKAAIDPARAAYVADPNPTTRARLTQAINAYGQANFALVQERAPVKRAQEAVDAAHADLVNKQGALSDASGKVDKARANLQNAKAASAKAAQDLQAAKANLTKVKNSPAEKAKQKAPSVGRGIGGVGNLVQGIGLVIYGNDLRKAGDIALGNINIAQGALWTAVGTGDAVDGTIKFFGDSLGKIKIPRVWGMTTLGGITPLVSTSMDVLGAFAGIGLTIAGVVLQLKEEKKEAVNETHTVDTTLAKYGITGGPTTPQDVISAGPLGNPTPLPGGTGGPGTGSGARPG